MRAGTVDLRLGAMRIQADKADVYEDPQPDGSVKRRLVAEGNVVFIRGEERLSGDRVEMDESGRGFFENAVGFVEPGVFIEGRRVERVDDDTYRVEGGKFTSCAQPNPRWSFTASSARVEVDDKVVAKNSVLKVKGIPVFYAPYIYYPIRKDGRSTGFLFPHFGYSSYRGFNVGTGFFWAMGRSLDQTFYADNYSKVGYGFGHELRYAADSPSRGTFRTYLFQYQGTPAVLDPDTGEVVEEGTPANTDYDVDWNALQMLPGAVRATVNVRKYSNLTFNQRFQDSFNRVTNRTEHWSAALEKDLKLAVLSASMDTTSTYFGTDYQRINGRLPGLSLRRFPRQVGWGGVVFGLLANADRLQYGDVDRGRLLDAVRLRPHRRAAVPAQLPGAQPLRRLPLHPLRRELRAGRGGPERDRRPGPQPVVLRDADGDAGADLLPRLRHPRLRLLRALQAHDRARGLLDVQDAGRGLQLHPEVRRGRLLPRHQPDRLLARPALLREAPRADRQGAALRVLQLAARCRPTTSRSRTGRATSTRTTRPPCSAPASSPSTSRPSCRGCG